MMEYTKVNIFQMPEKVEQIHKAKCFSIARPNQGSPLQAVPIYCSNDSQEILNKRGMLFNDRFSAELFINYINDKPLLVDFMSHKIRKHALQQSYLTPIEDTYKFSGGIELTEEVEFVVKNHEFNWINVCESLFGYTAAAGTKVKVSVSDNVSSQFHGETGTILNTTENLSIKQSDQTYINLSHGVFVIVVEFDNKKLPLSFLPLNPTQVQLKG